MKTENNFDHLGLNLVAGVVVLYNPKLDVIENIDSYLNQIDFLYIIDNSEKKSNFISEYFQSVEKIEYLFNNYNFGIAAALNIAANKAISRGFIFLLTMDQDSKAPANMINSLLEVARNNKNVGIASPLHSNKYGTHLAKKDPVEKVIIAMTSGNLLSLEAYKKLGQFNEEYFIDYVDIEYCFRMHRYGYEIIRLNDVILEHNEADLSARKIFNRTYYPHNHKPFRLYYKTRNLLYLREKYKNIAPHLLKTEYDSFIRTVIKIILFENERIVKLKMILSGITDYFKKKKGKVL